MKAKYVSVTVEYGRIDLDESGNSIVCDDHTEYFESVDSSASYADLFDDLAFEIRNSLT